MIYFVLVLIVVGLLAYDPFGFLGSVLVLLSVIGSLLIRTLSKGLEWLRYSEIRRAGRPEDEYHL